MNQPSYNRVEPNPPLDFLIILGIIVMLILIAPIVFVRIVWDLIARIFNKGESNGT